MRGNFARKVTGDFYLFPLSQLWWNHTTRDMQCEEGSRETRHKRCGERQARRVGSQQVPPPFPTCCQPQGCAGHCCTSIGVAQRRPWIWPLFSVSFNLFHERLGVHLKAIVPSPSALISRLFKTRTALVVRNLCQISRLCLFSC